MGGMLGQHLALHAEGSRRLERLVLCATAASTRGQEAVWAERIERVTREQLLAFLAEATMQRWFTASADASVIAATRRLFEATSPAGYCGHAAAIASHHLDASITWTRRGSQQLLCRPW
jgi:3-oxoadipate enol-lactonase